MVFYSHHCKLVPLLITFHSKCLNKAFDDQWLVAIEFKSSDVSSLSWSDMKKMNPSQVGTAFGGTNIVMCKRNSTGQFYVARGLRDMVHFTLGTEGKTQLTAFLKKNMVKYYELRGENSDCNHPAWFQVLSLSKKNTKERSFLESVDMQLKTIARDLIPELMKVSPLLQMTLIRI